MNRFFLIGVAGILFVEAFRFWWFHPVEQKETWSQMPRLTLEVSKIAKQTDLSPIPLAGNVETGALQFDRAIFLRSPVEQNEPLRSLLFMEYRAGNSSVWNDLFTHPPEVCMRSAGCTLAEELPTRFVEVEGRQIPVRCLKFLEPVTSAPLFIYKMVWLPEESPIQPRTDMPEKRPLWIEMALSRKPSPPGAVFLARVQREPDPEAAWKWVEKEMLPQLRLVQAAE
jgi:hypothetical protein